MSRLFLRRKLHLFLEKSTHAAVTKAALFDYNVHQIVCRLGLRTRPHWGSLQRSPRLLAVFRGPSSKGRKWERREGGTINEGERKGRAGRKRKKEEVDEGASSSFALGSKKKSRHL